MTLPSKFNTDFAERQVWLAPPSQREGEGKGDKELGGSPNEVKTVWVNGASRSFEHVLADGDRVGIFPAIGGG